MHVGHRKKFVKNRYAMKFCRRMLDITKVWRDRYVGNRKNRHAIQLYKYMWDITKCVKNIYAM